MKIKNKYKNSIVEIIEEDEDIENLTEGEKYYRVWEDGEFQLYEVPKVETDGSIIIQKDTILSVTDLIILQPILLVYPYQEVLLGLLISGKVISKYIFFNKSPDLLIVQLIVLLKSDLPLIVCSMVVI